MGDNRAAAHRRGRHRLSSGEAESEPKVGGLKLLDWTVDVPHMSAVDEYEAQNSLPDEDEEGALWRLRLSHVKGRAKALGMEVVNKRGSSYFSLLHSGSELVPYESPSLMTVDRLETKLTELENKVSKR